MKTTHGITSALLAGVVGLGCGEVPAPDDVTGGAPNDIEVTQSEVIQNCQWGNGQYIRVVDFNADGKMDVVSPNGLRIERYQSTGPFSYTFLNVASQGSSNPLGTAEYTWAGQFDGTGGGDLASASGNSVYIKSGATPTAVTWTVPSNVWGSAGYTFAADFTGDGKSDIATAFGNTINLLVKSPSSNFMDLTTSNKPSGSFTWGGAANPLTGTGYTWAKDFSGDGRPDIGTAVGGTVYMKVFNPATNKFTESNWTTSNLWGGSDYTFAADFTGDGRADIASFSGSSAYMKISTGNGFVQGNTTWSVANLWGGSNYTWVADFTGDGRADIASVSGGNLYLKFANADGTNFVSRTLSVANSWGSSDSTRVGDFTGDGRADIVTFIGCNGSLHEFTPDPVNTWRITTHPL